MPLESRLVKLEAAMGARPDPGADAAFAPLVATLDRLAGELAQGGEAETKARKELADLRIGAGGGGRDAAAGR